ncbi:MAG: hypothetical protein K9H64_22935 [Bacteroidales bacterium]|nr:hypothetical protein [Bacteroidales bacterium]
MDELMLFTDGSVDTLSKVGYGAYLLVSEAKPSVEAMKSQVKVKRFESTSSSKLELQSLLWALGEIQSLGKKVIVYTDSQNIMGLICRRDRLQKNDYRSKKNKRISNYELYQEFYRLTKLLEVVFVKVSGHLVSYKKDDVDKLFTLVDRASRNALRENNQPSVFSPETSI